MQDTLGPSIKDVRKVGGFVKSERREGGLGKCGRPQNFADFPQCTKFDINLDKNW